MCVSVRILELLFHVNSNFYPNFTKVKTGYSMMIDGRRAIGVKTFVTLFSETTNPRVLKFCMQPPIVVLQVVSDFQVCRRSTSCLTKFGFLCL